MIHPLPLPAQAGKSVIPNYLWQHPSPCEREMSVSSDSISFDVLIDFKTRGHKRQVMGAGLLSQSAPQTVRML